MALEIDSVILAAGFGTRLGNLGEELPKGLIEGSGGVKLIARVLEELAKTPGRICIITNGRFSDLYKDWIENSVFKDRIELYSNGILTSECRNGAIKDLEISIKYFGLSRNLLVAPSDTLFGFKIEDFLKFCAQDPESFAVIAEKKESVEEIRGRLGCPTIEGDSVISFIEKPVNPPSVYGIIPFYYYPKDLIPKITEFLENGGNPDAPSNIISWLIDQNIEVRAYKASGKSIDVGTVSDVNRIQAK